MIEDELLDGVVALGDACMWMDEYDECEACSKKAKEGFVRLLGENSAKAVYAAFKVAGQLEDEDEMIAEYRRLWEMAKVSLPDEAITYDVANDLGEYLREKGEHEQVKVIHLAALEGR